MSLVPNRGCPYVFVFLILIKIMIINKVGKAVAHDEYVPFRVTKGKILVNDEESEMVGKKIKVEFIKVKK